MEPDVDHDKVMHSILMRHKGNEIVWLAKNLYLHGRSTVESSIADATRFLDAVDAFEREWKREHGITDAENLPMSVQKRI